jgi:hypothetical protein
MRSFSQTVSFVSFATLGLACPAKEEPLDEVGESDTDSDSGTDSTGDGDCPEPQTFELNFAVAGLLPEETDVTLTCSATASGEPSNQVIALTACMDDQSQAHGDVEVTLTGDWTGLAIGDAEPTTLRFVQQANGESLDRWLTLETNGQFPLPLVAVSASDLVPTNTSFGFGPIALGIETMDCPTSEHPGGCGPVASLALTADYSDDPRTIPDGSQITDLGGAEGGDSVQFVVTVAWARELLDNGCEDAPDRTLVFGIVAYPNS